MTEMKARFKRWPSEHPIMLAIGYGALTFLIVLGGLWAFAPRVSTDDALWTAVKLAAITLGTTYIGPRVQRARGLRNPG